jgi:hypothetical protein
MMGTSGLTDATSIAILSANYMASRLSDSYPVLYTGSKGRVAHECIIDIRDIQDRCGISNEDIAKRLIDFGFHAPTMSFPVAGTLMIEPTESESLAEIDRCCPSQPRSGGWNQVNGQLMTIRWSTHRIRLTRCLSMTGSMPIRAALLPIPTVTGSRINTGRLSGVWIMPMVTAI